MFENEVYDGICELLTRLKASGRTLVVATSKPEVFALEILRHFDLYKYFDFVAGATLNDVRNQKADIIKYALETLNITEKKSAIMIGDRKHDIIGAKETGLDSIGVLYGYGTYDELKNAGATYIADTPADIWNKVL